MQKLDDVTGDAIRLSSRDRERQRHLTIAQINSIIVQLNAVTQAVNKLNEQLTKTTSTADAAFAMWASWGSRTWRARLRWLFRGK